MCVPECMDTGSYGGQKSVLDSLELDVQVVTSCLTWAVGTKPGPSAKAADVLNRQTSSLISKS